MERMKKPKFIKEIEKSEGKERAKCGRWYIRVYGELDHKPMVELESLEIVIKELHKLEEENRKLRKENEQLKDRFMLRLAEAYLLPPKSPQMAEMKKRDFSKWYKEIKNQMRKEILEGK